MILILRVYFHIEPGVIAIAPIMVLAFGHLVHPFSTRTHCLTSSQHNHVVPNERFIGFSSQFPPFTLLKTKWRSSNLRMPQNNHSIVTMLQQKQVSSLSGQQRLEEPLSKNISDSTTSTFTNPDLQQFEAAVDQGKQFFGIWENLVSPSFTGIDNISKALELSSLSSNIQSRPILFVGNHSVFGLLDTSLLYIKLTQHLGERRLRSLADPIHFNLFSDITSGRWGNFVRDLGAVQASARNFYRLLSAGECILLFPGGAREVCRRRGEEYQLFWKDDTDFLRPAAKHNAVIVPFSAVGADDSVRILIDGQELQKLPGIGDRVQGYLEENQLSKENLMPVALLPPKPDRYYFEFYEPIDTKEVNPRDDERCKIIYEQTKATVEGGMKRLLTTREKDPQRYVETRLLEGLKKVRKENNLFMNFNPLRSLLSPVFDL